MMKENLLIDKSIAFASRIIKLHQYLIRTKKETIISKQIVRSGTSIGANINEANYGQSRADFVSKMHIALKETAETEYIYGEGECFLCRLCKRRESSPFFFLFFRV